MEAVRTTITIEKALLYRVREDAKANRRDLSAEVCQLIDEAHKARDAGVMLRAAQRKRARK